MYLRVNGSAVSGTASGEVRSGGVLVAVNGGTPGSTATLTGITTRLFVSGTLDGAVMIGGAGCSNNGHRWSLGPRVPARSARNGII
jgi:hypothetical protein